MIAQGLPTITDVSARLAATSPSRLRWGRSLWASVTVTAFMATGTWYCSAALRTDSTEALLRLASNTTMAASLNQLLLRWMYCGRMS